jgi:GNAT superfamily N-acetyltransferase
MYRSAQMLTYRHGTVDDVPVLAQLWHDMLIESKVSGSGFVQDWRERLERDFAEQIPAGTMSWFVAEEHGHIVGTAAALFTHNTGGILLDLQATLAGIYTATGYRRRGIARELTERAIAWCKERGCVRIRLQASEAGRPLYESLGFRTFREMMKLDLRPSIPQGDTA